MLIHVSSLQGDRTFEAIDPGCEYRVGRAGRNEIALPEESGAAVDHGAFVHRPGGWVFVHHAWWESTLIRRGSGEICLDRDLCEDPLVEGDQICIGATVLTVQGDLPIAMAPDEPGTTRRTSGGVRARGAAVAMASLAVLPSSRQAVRTRGEAVRTRGEAVRTRGEAVRTRGESSRDRATLLQLVALDEKIRQCTRDAVRAGKPLRSATQEVFEQFAYALSQLLPDATGVALVLEAEQAFHRHAPCKVVLALGCPEASRGGSLPPTIPASVYQRTKAEEKVVFWQNSHAVPSSEEFLPVYSLLCHPLLADDTFVGALQISTDKVGVTFGEDEALLVQPFANRFAQFWLEQRLQSARHQEFLAQLAAQIDHDLGNLLQQLWLNNGTALRFLKSSGEDTGLNSVAEFLDSNNKLLRLTSQHFRMLAEVLSGKAETKVVFALKDLREMAEEIQFLCANSLGKAKVEMSVTSSLAEPVVCCPQWLFMCLLNLCKNAWEAMANNPKDKPRQLHVNISSAPAVEPGERAYAVIEVADTGSGMTEEQVARFAARQPHTTKPEGLGLGTQSILRALELHQSPPPEVKSMLDQGTTVWVKIPMDLEPTRE